MASEYILQDRSLATKWALKVDNGELYFESTLSSAQDEPIVEDETDAGIYHKIFITGGELGYEETLTAEDDEVLLDDATTGITYQLAVSADEFYLKVSSQPVRQLVSIKVTVNVNVAKSSVNVNIFKSQPVYQTYKNRLIS